MKLRRYLLATLVLFMFSLATGCGNSPANSTEDAAISTANAAVATTSVQEQSTSVQAQSTTMEEESAAAASGPWKLLLSTDVGNNVNITGFLNDKTGITAGYGGAVQHTENGGTYWSPGINNSYCRFGLDIADEKTAWTCGNKGHVRKTTDGGKSWGALADFGDSSPTQCRFISFADDKNGWIAAPRRFASTNDGGNSWTEITLPDGMAKLAAISLSTAQNGYLFDYNGVLYITQDGAKTWTTKQVPIKGKILNGPQTPVAAMHFTDANNAVLAVDIQTETGTQVWVLKTVDGGDNWEQTLIPDINTATVFLSRDTKYLTLYNNVKKQAFLFNYQAG